MSRQSVPQHVAIIMDGNGRWATAKGLPRNMGHKKGADSIRAVMEAARDNKVKYLTLYAFSSENWQRSDDEVQKLMDLLRYYLEHELPSLHKLKIKMRFIGNIKQLPDDIQRDIAKAEQITSTNDEHILTIALSYGSRQEIVATCKSIATQVSTGLLDPATITEEIVASNLYTAGLPDPDLLIRTGGEQRLSNFLLWQSAYTELYFTDTLWPDFKKEAFEAALDDYTNRERRFGR